MLKRKKGRILVMIVVILLILVGIAGVLIGNYFYNYALNPKSGLGISGEEEYVSQMSKEKQEARKLNLQWLDDHAQDIFIESEDELKLHGYRIPSEQESNRYVILSHGYKGQGKDMVIHARHFYEQNYHMLIPDARGHGESGGDYIGMGWPERKDMVKWIDSIVEQNKDAEIVLLGVSMGGATVMMTSGETLPENVKAIIEDCGYTSASEEFGYQLKAMFGLPEFPVLPLASLATKTRAGYSLYEASAIEAVKRSKTPMLFIHGEADDFVPFYMLDKVYEAAACEKEKLVIEGAAHGQAREKGEKLYWETVDRFLENKIE